MKLRSFFYESAVAAVSSAEDLPVNVNRFNHADIVDGLYELLHESWPVGPFRDTLRILHADGSESARFPLFHMETAPCWDKTARPLRLGFVSGRHPEMDRIIDIYLLRNSEISQFDTSADLEQEVYERTQRLLLEAESAGRTAIEAFHTGLETITIAVYRAAVDYCRNAKSRERPRQTILLCPKIWGTSRVNLTRLATEALSELNLQLILEKLERLIADVPAFLKINRLSNSPGGAILFEWLPERPMFASEHDWLVRRARPVKPVVDSLFQNAQYRNGEVWRLG